MKTREEIVKKLDDLEKEHTALRDLMYNFQGDPAEKMFYLEKTRQELQKISERIDMYNWILNEK